MGLFDSIKNALGGKTEADTSNTTDPGDTAVQDKLSETVPAQIDTPEAPASDTTTADAETESGAQTYTVQSGDTLWKISEQVYGNGSRYMNIFEANTDLLETPDQILPGQKLHIPELDT